MILKNPHFPPLSHLCGNMSQPLPSRLGPRPQMQILQRTSTQPRGSAPLFLFLAKAGQRHQKIWNQWQLNTADGEAVWGRQKMHGGPPHFNLYIKMSTILQGKYYLPDCPRLPVSLSFYVFVLLGKCHPLFQPDFGCLWTQRVNGVTRLQIINLPSPACHVKSVCPLLNLSTSNTADFKSWWLTFLLVFVFLPLLDLLPPHPLRQPSPHFSSLLAFPPPAFSNSPAVKPIKSS